MSDASVMLKANFTDLHDARFREVYEDTLKDVKTYYDKIFQTVDSDKSYEMYSAVSGHTMMQPKAEDATGEGDKRIQGYDATLTNDSFYLRAKISYENIKDDQFNVLEKEAANLAEAGRITPDIQAADAFKRGFLTTDLNGNAMTASDGIRHFSTLHYKNPDETSTTYSNASATGVVLSDDNLETGILALEGQKNLRGLSKKCKASWLVVPPALRKTALIITGSDKRSETSDNDANVYKTMESYYGGKLDVIIWDEIGTNTSQGTGSNTAWFLMDQKKHELTFQWRERPYVLPVEFNTEKMRYEYPLFGRWAWGMIDWRGTWGSKGDGAAYSS